MPKKHLIQLQTGELQVSVLRARFPLDTLLTFGSRLNPKRRFLFVSKVLGKYVPCQPNAMRESYLAMAEQIQPFIAESANVWVLGVAETATGLAAGVAQEITRKSCAAMILDKNATVDNTSTEKKLIFSHTTRCELAKAIDFKIVEAHSHAPSHLIYQLEDKHDYQSVTSVVLVDDEISTGKTLAQLTENILERLPQLTTIIWASLVNWISEHQRQDFKKRYPSITLEFCSLLDGTFSFSADECFQEELPEKTATGISNALCRSDLGRAGYLMGTQPSIEFKSLEGQLITSNLDKSKAYVVVGTGEFSYQPFLLAEYMQQLGFDVLFQSTGRSPAIEDHGISSKLSGFDEGQQGTYYLYNFPQHRQPIICYENIEQYQSCPFKDDLQAQVAILDRFSVNTA
ncbi:MAG: phosphoribosyltransferase domain-containing protein [Oceanospirillaceae bacterium]